jgi:hypothetical protein
VTNREAEFAILRQTIATRGTVRVVLVAATVVSWATLATAQGLFSDLPLLVLIPLSVLVAGYESVWALHVGVERIGRFIQVTYESMPGGATWETTAMKTGPALPGSGVNPLASLVFAGASLVNLGTAFVAEPTPLEIVVLFGGHAAFLLRLIHTRLVAGRQRQADLTMFAAAGSGTRETSSEFEKS